MRDPLPMRRLARGMPSMLLAALLLFARLIAPAAATPGAPAGIAQLALQTLCHGGAAGDQAPEQVPGQHDCLLCAACCAASQAAIPSPPAPLLLAPRLTSIGQAPPPALADAPRPRPRRVAQPTGPPTPSA